MSKLSLATHPKIMVWSYFLRAVVVVVIVLLLLLLLPLLTTVLSQTGVILILIFSFIDVSLIQET